MDHKLENNEILIKNYDHVLTLFHVLKNNDYKTEVNEEVFFADVKNIDDIKGFEYDLLFCLNNYADVFYLKIDKENKTFMPWSKRIINY